MCRSHVRVRATTLAALAATVTFATSLAAEPGVGLDPRLVQIRSIDFEARTIELFNFAPDAIDLTGWRFCSHDFDQARRYSGANGLDGVTIEAGSSFVVHFDDDAPIGDPDAINRSDLGGEFATELDSDAYGMQLFRPGPGGTVNFSDSTLIADHLQWNIDGAGTGQSETRSAQAVSVNLWTATGAFIATTEDTLRITLVDRTGGTLHGPDDYVAEEPAPCVGDINGDGGVGADDLAVLLGAWGDITFGPADLNSSGTVDAADLAILLGSWGPCP